MLVPGRLRSAEQQPVLTIPSKPERGTAVQTDVLPPEPVEIAQEIRAGRGAVEVLDAGKNLDLVARRITERLARAQFQLTASSTIVPASESSRRGNATRPSNRIQDHQSVAPGVVAEKVPEEGPVEVEG